MTPNDVSNRILVLTTEHAACRSEILQLSTKQQQLLIASFAVTGYAFTKLILQQDKGLELNVLPHTWFALGIVLAALNLLFVDCDRAIIRCATYVDGFLKVEITRLLIGPRKGGKSGSREAFNSKVEQPSVDLDYDLHTVQEIQDIINEGVKDPMKREAEDCRLLEWESYIRGKGYLSRKHLPNFRFQPNNASVQGSLIFLPALLCFGAFVRYSCMEGLTGYLVLIFGAEVVFGIICIAYTAYRLYYVVPSQKMGFPPGHPHTS